MYLEDIYGSVEEAKRQIADILKRNRRERKYSFERLDEIVKGICSKSISCKTYEQDPQKLTSLTVIVVLSALNLPVGAVFTRVVLWLKKRENLDALIASKVSKNPKWRVQDVGVGCLFEDVLDKAVTVLYGMLLEEIGD